MPRRAVTDDTDLTEKPWYSDGLCFECTQCGKCCTSTAPGTVRVSGAEIEALAAHLGVSPSQFREIYTKPVEGGLTSLREKQNFDCIFLSEAGGCEVYEHRPKQCRTWPFWRAIVQSPERWEGFAEDCPGMNRGMRYDAETIERTAADDGTSGKLV